MWKMGINAKQAGKLIIPVLMLVLLIHGISILQPAIEPTTQNVPSSLTMFSNVNRTSLEGLVEPIDARDWNVKFPKYNVSENITSSAWWKSAAFIELDLKMRPVDYRCNKFRTVGNWWICMDRPYQVQRPCLVYSFGVGFDFRFDDAMARRGCEVHSFDPSMGLKEYTRKSRVHFHPIGLGHVTTTRFVPRRDMYVKRNTTWQIMTLKSVMEKLGHINRTIDVLKIDIEGYEWDVLKDFLDNNVFKNVRQFMLEYHLFPTWPPKDRYPEILNIYKTLLDIGFKKFVTSMHPLNHNPKSFNIQADVAYVNTRWGKR